MVDPRIAETGFTEVYRPKVEDGEPVVEIILVHGLQGHPYKTWVSGPSTEEDGSNRKRDRKRDRTNVDVASEPSGQGNKEFSKGTPIRKKAHGVRRLVTKARKVLQSRPKADAAAKGKEIVRTEQKPNDESKEAEEAQLDDTQDAAEVSGGNNGSQVDDPSPDQASKVFWPVQLLPAQCPKARVSVYGYGTKVAGYKGVVKDHLYQIGKNFLYQLALHRNGNLPIVFIAHSLGGIVVKEALIMSSESHEKDLHSIISSTAAVVFMGTPHRGSKAFASTGEKGRKLASALLMNNNPALLDTLGLKNGDLFRSGDKFTQLWDDYNFTVKTYQEGRPFSAVGIGHLGDKVVPDESSLLSNLKERAESLDADHSRMCKFRGANDENWRRVGPQLKKYYETAMAPIGAPSDMAWSRLTLEELQALLSYAGMDDAEYDIAPPIEGTCQWIFKSPIFTSWIDNKGSPILCINGKIGSGKSTLMRHIFGSLKGQHIAGRNVVAFFCSSSKSTVTSRVPADIFRSFLVQLFRVPSFQRDALEFTHEHGSKLLRQEVQWHPRELQEAFMKLFRKPRSDRTIVFIDALDECTDAEKLVEMFQDLASFPKLKICLSSQDVPAAVGYQCECISMEDFNHDDIALYARQKLHIDSVLSKRQCSFLRNAIVEKARGVFLWVILLVDLLQRHLHDGRDFSFLRAALDDTPKHLEELYCDIIFRSVDLADPTQARDMIHVLQWVLLAARPLSIEEWHHVLAFIQNPSLRSVAEWESSKTYTESNDLLIQRIKRICRGFVDTKDRLVPVISEATTPSEASSLGVRAGSFESHQYIEVIHSSVRTFFLEMGGFTLLDPSITKPRSEGHLYILEVCIRYWFLEEMKKAFTVRPAGLAGTRESLDLMRVAKTLESIEPMEPTYSEGAVTPYRPDYQKDLWEDPNLQLTTRTMSLGSSAGSSASSLHSINAWGSHQLEELRKPLAFVTVPNYVSDKEEVWEYLKDLHDPFRDLAECTSASNSYTGRGSAQSSPGRFRAVDNPPALWQYSQDMLLFHATAADQEAADPKKPLDLLLSQDWRAWGATREDMQNNATVQYFAAQWNLVSWLKHLIDVREYQANARGGVFSYPIIVAAKMGSKDAFEFLLSRDPQSLTCVDHYLRTALHYAAALPNSCILDVLCKFTRENANSLFCLPIRQIVDARDRTGITALHLAAMHSSSKAVSNILSIGAKVNCVDNRGNTPLHVACLREDPDMSVCNALLEAGCDVTIRNDDGEYAMGIALRRGIRLDLLKYPGLQG